jgi:hypothetical protein
MKKYYARLRIMLMAFALGLSLVWFFDNLHFSDKFEELSETDLENVTFISTQQFVASGRGCGGGGYSQNYSTMNGDWLGEGVSKISHKTFYNSLKGSEIIERIENAPNRNGEIGLRLITKNASEKGKSYFEILWYHNGVLYYISSNSLETAIEFEETNSYIH